MHPHDETMDQLLVQICRLHHSRARTLFGQIGIYRGQPPLLLALWEQDGLTQSELAELLHVTAATITKMVQRMENAGFVERRPDADDQRVSRVYLAERGHEIKAEVGRVWRALELECWEGFTQEELVLLRRFLTQVRDNLMRASGETVPPVP